VLQLHGQFIVRFDQLHAAGLFLKRPLDCENRIEAVVLRFFVPNRIVYPI
jgi:hypothetical protein